MSFIVKELYVEYQKAPIGLDEEHPRFSWMFSSDEKNMRQRACRIVVKKGMPAAKKKVVWDSGRLETGESRGIEYAGEKLEACTEYSVSVQVWDAGENSACADTRFETGLFAFPQMKRKGTVPGKGRSGSRPPVSMSAYRPEGCLSWRPGCVWNPGRREPAWYSVPMISGCSIRT